jgi:Calcineurin-like phosphoesterase
MPKARPRKKATASKKAQKKATKKTRPASKKAKTKGVKTKAVKKAVLSKKVQTKAAKKAPASKKSQKKATKPAQPAQPARRKFTETQLRELRARVQADPKLLSIAGYMNSFLEASEYQVIEMMEHNNVWSGPKPPAPPGSGSAEFGLLDYWLNNPGSDWVLKELQAVWMYVIGSLPVTQINATNYQNLLNAVAPNKPGLIAADGTWFSESPFSLDPGWTLALIEYVYSLFTQKYYKPFPQRQILVPIKGANSSYVTIALVGDWGTGNYPNGPAASVMQGITALNPDYIIHLGDVYYAGTTGEEQSNLLGMWPAAYSGRSFTLNSNHEMYDGGFGYFQTALGSKIFSSQRATSYFALQYGNPNQPGGPWTILGLDSAYWSTSPMVMNGSIQESSSESGAMAQPQFIQQLMRSGLSPRNTIVLTHHNPIEYDGSALVTDDLGNNLWAQVTKAFGGTPTAWYWGHVHNGIVYPNPTFTRNNVYGRCVGHGAIPYGNGWGLAAAPASQVTAYANTPNAKVPPRVMNGFVMLTITTTGQVTEAFFQQDGTVAPWVKPFRYQLR